MNWVKVNYLRGFMPLQKIPNYQLAIIDPWIEKTF